MAARLLLAASVAALLLMLLAAGGYAWRQLEIRVETDTLFEIRKGSSLSLIVRELARQDILEVHEPAFRVAALFTGGQGAVRAGQYRLQAGMNLLDLLALFHSGTVVQHRITFPEGWTLEAWRDHLLQAPHLDIRTDGLTRTRLSELLGIEGDPEGWLFPDTYQYAKGDSDIEILRLAHRKMTEVLAEEWRRRAAPPLATAYEALILASIIEKETGHAPDREKIGAVFHNRLIRGMRLQSDPTVIYGLGEAFDGDLRRAGLRADSPWNTYTRRGLPPTPICSPGRASLRAALKAAHHPYLYFVSMGDGRSFFSVTLEEHNAAVNRFQRGG